MSTPIVSAVIVNRNGAEHLRMCLPSLRAQSYQAIELIVVDNASSDDSAAVAESVGARLIALKENIGLGPALNHGVASATGEFLLFVNNDMRFHESFVASLVAPFANDESVFAADGMQYNWDGTVKGHLAPRLMTGRLEDGTATELVPGLSFYLEEKNQITPVFMGSAASMLVRRSYFEKIGGFDEDIPLGYEDVDICWRAWLAGWKTIYVPDAVCWHRVGSSSRSPEGALFLFVGVLKGRLAFASRLLPTRYGVAAWLVSIGGLVKDVSRLKWRFAWTRVKVLAYFGMKIPRFIAARQMIFKEAGITPSQQLQRMLDLGKTEIADACWSSSQEKSAAV